MKLYFNILLCTMLVLTGTFGQTFAATMDQIADGSPYDIIVKAKIKVKNAFSDKSTSGGNVFITDDTPTTGSFDLDDFANPFGNVTGTLTLFKGKKVVFVVDADGLFTIEKTIINWVTNLADRKSVV